VVNDRGNDRANERANDWEDGLRRELGLAVQDVQAREDLLGVVREGGRRRVRRRRALTAVPAAGLVVGGAVWAGVARTAPAPVAPATPVTSAPVLEPTPSEAPLSFEVAIQVFYAHHYEYDDAEILADLWQVDVSEAKAKAGRLLDDGQPLPGAELGVSPESP